MSDAKSPSDLSIDEILTTIRRIISEDEQVSAAAEAATEASAATAGAAAPGAGGRSGGAAGEAAARLGGELDDVLELTEMINEDGTTRHLAPIGGSARRPAPPPAPLMQQGGAPAAAPAQLPRDLPVGGGARTLEDIVGDVLRPLLQAWLAENLPPLVARLVQAEIARRVAREVGSA